MKSFVFVLFVVACATAETYFSDSLLRTAGTTITDADASCKIGTPPAAYETLFADDKIASDRLLQGIAILKRMFHTGIHPIPVLDPFKKDVMGPFNIDNRLIRGQITMRNVVISGFKGLKLDDLVMRLHYDEQFRVDSNSTIPLLEFSAELETNVKVKKIIPIKVKGGISLSLNDLKITGAVGGRPVVGADGKTTLVLDSVHGYGRAAVALVSLLFNKAVQKIIESKGMGVKMIYKAGRDEIGAAIGEMIIKEGNEVLSRLTLDQVQAYLLGED